MRSTTHTIYQLVATVLLTAVLSACGGADSQSTASQSASATAASADASSIETPGSETFKPDSTNPAKETAKSESAYAPGRVLVRYLDPTPASGRIPSSVDLAGLGFKVLKEINFANEADTKLRKLNGVDADAKPAPKFAVLDITGSGMTVAQAVEKLKASGKVQYAQPDYLKNYHVAPNDTYYSLQWHLKNTGQISTINSQVGIANDDIGAESAWGITTGSNAANAPVIGVLDCGFMLTHPDLTATWWVNPNPGASGIANDINGADLFNNTGNPTNAASCLHGTQVVGAMAASGNNALGVSGVMQNSKVMALRIGDNAGGLSSSAIVAAINYAIGRKAAGVNLRALNMSYGGTAFDTAEYDAMAALNNAGVLAIASAGNDGNSVPNYPAAYQLPNIISVAATDRTDALASFSSYGSTVHVAAPGQDIATTTIINGVADYALVDGTSFSAPIVAGIAGLLATNNPSLTMQQIRQRILSSAKYIPAFYGKMKVPGRVSAYAALTTPTTYFYPFFQSNEQYVQNANHVFRAFAPVGAATTGVIATVGGTNFTLKDDGKWPDLVAGDGEYAGVIKYNGTGAPAVSLSHQYDLGAGVQSSSLTGVAANFGAPLNYQATTTTYSWMEPVGALGVQAVFASAADETVTTIATPFPISFYGLSGFTQLRVSSNGFVCVSSIACGNLNNALYNAQPIPGNGLLSTLGIIAPWWHDWVLTGNAASSAVPSNVYTHSTGTTPNRVFAVTWKNAMPYNSTTSSVNGVSFQVQFYEGQNKFTFSYNDVSTDQTSAATQPDGGLLGSSGVQFYNGRIGTRTSYKTAGSIVAGTSKNLTWGTSFPEITASVNADALTDVEGLRGAYITVGCLGGTAYCPNDVVTRIQMAAFLARATRGHDLLVDYTAIPLANFSDVTDPNERKYVSAIKQSGITNGCLGGTQYCRLTNVSREQMALFLMRAVRGSTFVPPPGIGIVEGSTAIG